MRIAVMGAGGIGGFYGALLSRAGHEVILIARGAHLEAIRYQTGDKGVSLYVRGLIGREREQAGTVPGWLMEIAPPPDDMPLATVYQEQLDRILARGRSKRMTAKDDGEG